MLFLNLIQVSNSDHTPIIQEINYLYKKYYAWGLTGTRVEIPVKNIKDRQTYYGALDAQSKEFIIREYSAGNGESTVEFIKYLQRQRPGRRIVLIWDGASYHRFR